MWVFYEKLVIPISTSFSTASGDILFSYTVAHKFINDQLSRTSDINYWFMERKLLLNSPLLCCYGCILYDVTYETMNGVNADIESDGNYGYTENEELNMKPISFDRFYKYDKKSPKIIFLLYLLCCGSVILSLIDTCFIAYLWVAKSSNTAPEVRSIYHGNRVCVPCDMLDDVSLSTRDKTLSTLCCFSNQTEATAAKVTEAVSICLHIVSLHWHIETGIESWSGQ